LGGIAKVDEQIDLFFEAGVWFYSLAYVFHTNLGAEFFIISGLSEGSELFAHEADAKGIHAHIFPHGCQIRCRVERQDCLPVGQ
jgi:hypothetical protein